MPLLAKEDLHVWLARPASMPASSVAHCLATLSEDERERTSRFRFARHQREATVSRALLRATLARYVGVPPSVLRYRLGPHGRPHLDPACGLSFSSTNHPELVACGVSRDDEIGIDTEPLTRGDEILEVARTVFSPPELEALESLSAEARRDRAVSLWTCKEAYIKARGLGFAASLRKVVVDFPPDQRPRLRFLSGYDDPVGWWIDTRDVMGFRLAVAVRTTAADVRVLVRTKSWDDDASPDS